VVPAKPLDVRVQSKLDQYHRRMVETSRRADGQFKVLRLTSDTSFAAECAAERDLVGGDRTSA
jgi:hypothetical protein